MATYDPSAIRAQIKTLLQTSTLVSYVYDYNNPNIEGYPAIIFDITEEDSEMLDENNNTRVITFTLYAVVEIKVAGISVAKTLLDNVVKSVINLVEKRSNDTLSGTVDWVTPVMGRRVESNSPEGSFFSQEMKLRCNVASSIL